MKVKVTKVNGNNNTFVLLYKEALIKNPILNKNLINRICNFDNKIVDGLLVLEYINTKKIKLDYFNNDGTWETLCVNGVRCAALYIYNKYKIKEINVECGDGIHNTLIKGKNISVSMLEPFYVTNQINIYGHKGFFINSGAKHFITPIDDLKIDKNILIKIAKKIKSNTKEFPDGVNVNFYKIINKETIEVITYEKGIEDIVESCASGSFACAYHLVKKGLINKNINVINSGGSLKIKFSTNFNNNYIIAGAFIGKEYFINI